MVALSFYSKREGGEKTNKQDCNAARTAQDIERKYANLFQLKKNVETKLRELTKVENELNNFIKETVGDIENLQEQIDGKIDTYYYEGVPTLKNLPANEWTTEEEKEKHIKDLYYDKLTGYAYSFSKEQTDEDTEYKWNKIENKDTTEALAIANSAKDTADGKRSTFIKQPTPPYNNGDMWIKDNEIYICQVSKAEEQIFEESDFINNLKYTDDTIAKAVIDELGGKKTTVLKGTVVEISNSFAKFTDLADPTSSTTIAGEHINAGSITSNNYAKDSKGTKLNLNDGTIDTKNFKVDEDGNVKLGDGAKVIGGDGMMTNLSFENLKWSELGYKTDNFGGTNRYQYIELPIYIPDNFTIVEAKLTIEHIPVKWQGNGINIWGNARNIKIYKDSETSDFYKEYPIFATEDTSADDIYTSEIVGAFGASGFTSETPNNYSHHKEVVTSGNIASSLSKGSTKLQIRTGNVIPAYAPDIEDPDLMLPAQTNVLNQTGMAKVVINISGFMAYTNNEGDE